MMPKHVHKTVLVGLGSNLGDRQAMFVRALEMMRRIPGTHLVALSPVYYTDPVDGAGPGEFLNAVVQLQTALEPLELLDYIETIERALGRAAKGDFRPRTIDLDILLYADRVLQSSRLILPHPRMTERAFVLCPLYDLAPDTPVPPENVTVAEHWARLVDRTGVRPATEVTISLSGLDVAQPEHTQG